MARISKLYVSFIILLVIMAFVMVGCKGGGEDTKPAATKQESTHAPKEESTPAPKEESTPAPKEESTPDTTEKSEDH